MADAADDERTRWRTFGERTIYDNPWVWLGQVDVEQPDGERFWSHVVRLGRAAVMVLVDEQDRVLLMWRRRFVQDGWGWELLGGVIDEGEEPEAAAIRELEETGYRAGRVSLLAASSPSAFGDLHKRCGELSAHQRLRPQHPGRPRRDQAMERPTDRR